MESFLPAGVSLAGIRDNLNRILDRIRAAEARAGREDGSVRLVAVTKGFPAAVVSAGIAAGARRIGENRVQEAWQKKALVKDAGAAEWHLIGHLQTNKIARALETFDVVQSVDSERLASAIDARARALGRRVRVLVEVNASGEGAKTGAPFEALPALLEAARGLTGLDVRGLMAMGPLTDDEGAIRAAFARVRAAAEAAVAAGHLPGPSEGLELSMGMSDDFEAAILEGSTMIRIGRAIFGERLAGGGA